MLIKGQSKLGKCVDCQNFQELQCINEKLPIVGVMSETNNENTPGAIVTNYYTIEQFQKAINTMRVCLDFKKTLNV